MHFYDVGGVLVRRLVAGQRRLTMEVWTVDGWTSYPDVDQVLRHGHRLTEVQALALLRQSREQLGAPLPMAKMEARAVLRDRGRRA